MREDRPDKGAGDSPVLPGRRILMTGMLAGGCALCLQGLSGLSPALAGNRTRDRDLPLRNARWWKELEGGRVECELCPRKCRVADLERGACGVRENRGGKYYTLVHSRACSLHKDPIEKKPLNHVLPGTTSLSLATPGCNIECKFCQNWEIAQVRPEQVGTRHLPPSQVAALAKQHDTPTISCTYTEPVVFAEYAYDIAVAAADSDILTMLITNGYILREPLDELIEVVGAVKVDLKAYTETFYRDYCGGELAPVLEALRRLVTKGVWTELVVLLIPTLNDGDKELRDMARFIRDELGAEVPIHFTRFHPSYRIRNIPRTPISTLERARSIAMAEGLKFVYVGNVPGHPGNNTYCPGCGEVVIRRVGMAMISNSLDNGKCAACGKAIPGIWKRKRGQSLNRE